MSGKRSDGVMERCDVGVVGGEVEFIRERGIDIGDSEMEGGDVSVVSGCVEFGVEGCVDVINVGV